ncbi:MAG: ABC transporter ATP-binding protein [Candidatus Hydrogenedentota bacterium]
MSAVIETEQLTKIYESTMFGGQDVHALNNMDLAINQGEIFAYLGPNGSGKTTTIKMLLGLLFPTSGTIKLMGRKDIASSEIKRKIGYLPEGAYYPEFLKGDEILRFYGQLYGLHGKDLEKRIDHVMDVVSISFARKRLLRGYSKGMRQRIGLAQALLSDPDILILDEPTTGLDPLARKEMRDILSNLRDEGKTLMISSHELQEVELISDRVGIIYKGEMQIQGTLDELLTDRDITIEVETVDDATSATLSAKGLVVDDVTNTSALLRVPAAMSIYDAVGLCKESNININSIAPRRETLEELFVRTVGDASAKEVNPTLQKN